MSPEQVRGAGVDYRSDIFSLGIILYELALGQRLYRGPADAVMKRIVEEPIAPPTAVKRDFPPALELIVMRALEKRAEDRYQSAEEMRVDLEEFLADEGLRTGSRRMAAYMKEIFPQEGAAPAPPATTASLGDNGGVPLDVRVRDDSEELNFDRRAPMSLRFEAAPHEDEAAAPRYPAPIPTDEAPGAARAEAVAPTISLRAASSAPVKPNGVAKPPPIAGAARPDERPSLAAPRPEVVLAPTARPPASTSDAADQVSAPPRNRMGWVILVVLLLGAAALAFVGTR
jgi:hypothetical protein